MLKFSANFEGGEDEDENEDVVDAERVLDDVAGEEIERVILAAQLPDEQIESEGEEHPDDAPNGGFLDADDVLTPMETNQIDRQDREHAKVKGDPKRKWHGA